ncbi:hypothetical protein KSP40_PGU019536 [Platanthera guangdongensis]|uniref:Uncharacterized protein n=1 Tax=Platanthera guangdongensis TaxID=2320717 RepID=A0ABR2N2H4_9ASPA
MQPKTSPSAINSKRTPSPNMRRSSSVSSASSDSRLSKVSDRKPSPKPQYPSQEKQKTVRVSEMQQQWGQLQEDLKSALEELADLKKSNEESKQGKATIKLLESEAENAKESEAKMFESLLFQTKQLEQTKILLEESKLVIRNLPAKRESLPSTPSEEGVKKLRIELKLAVEAEEKSKKAMDDFAAALKEVSSELSVTKTEFANAKLKLQVALEDYHKIALAYEESAAAWKEKEDSFINYVAISEEEINKKDQEQRMAKKEASKLKDIIKQAVNEAAAVKESLEIARYENYELNEQLLKKESAFQLIMQDYERIKASEAAALDSVREMKILLADVESFRQLKLTNDDHNITKSVKKHSSGRWMNLNPLVLNGHRHSVGELDIVPGPVSDVRGIRIPSSLFGFDHLEGVMFKDADHENGEEKVKKTALRRIGDALRSSSSFLKS